MVIEFYIKELEGKGSSKEKNNFFVKYGVQYI